MNEIARGRFTVGKMQISADQTVTSSKWKIVSSAFAFFGQIDYATFYCFDDVNEPTLDGCKVDRPMKGEKRTTSGALEEGSRWE